MADEQSTAVNDTSNDESVVDDADDISWDDAMEDQDESEVSDSEQNEDLDDDASDDEGEAEEEPESEESTDEAEDETETDEQSEDEPNAPKTPEAAHNKQMYEQRQAEKAARESRIREAQAQYVAEAKDSEDPLATAVRQLQVDAYNNTVRSNETTLQTEYQRAMADFEVLRSDDPVVQNEIDSAIDAFQAQNVSVDKFGNPTEIRADLYAYLQAKAESISRLTGIREQRQADAKAKQKSKSLTPPSKTPRTPKVDPDLAAFDEEAGL